MILFVLYVLLSSMGIILFKLGANQISFEITKQAFGFHLSFYSLIGLLFYIISFILWMIIVSKNEVSIIVPLGLAATNVAILVGATLILGETISAFNIVGVLVIIFGVVLLNI